MKSSALLVAFFLLMLRSWFVTCFSSVAGAFAFEAGVDMPLVFSLFFCDFLLTLEHCSGTKRATAASHFFYDFQRAVGDCP